MGKAWKNGEGRARWDWTAVFKRQTGGYREDGEGCQRQGRQLWVRLAAGQHFPAAG